QCANARLWVVLPGAVMPFDRRALFWADLPRDAVCDPACSPQQRSGDLLPRGGAAPSPTTRSLRAVLRMRCGLTVRVGRPRALDRHKAAMVAGLNTAQEFHHVPDRFVHPQQ
ncbi:hypothetical protein ACQZ6Z_27635, partial [Agrobacterium vitis]